VTTKRLIFSKENEVTEAINVVKQKLEYYAYSNDVTDTTSEWLLDLCKLLDEVC
jgi:hypothetical protein